MDKEHLFVPNFGRNLEILVFLGYYTEHDSKKLSLNYLSSEEVGSDWSAIKITFTNRLFSGTE